MTEKDRVWGSEETTPEGARISETYRCGHAILAVGRDWEEANRMRLEMRHEHACNG